MFHEDAYVYDDSEATKPTNRDDAHDPDTIADPEGAASRKQATTPERGAAPAWVLDEFTWAESVDKSTGEIRYFMNPKPHIIREAAESAPTRLITAYQHLSDEDKRIGDQIAKDALNFIQTLTAINDYLPKAVLRNIADQAASGAVRVARWKNRAQGWLESLKDGAEQPEGLINLIAMMKDAGRVAAILRYAHIQLDPTSELNFTGAAWQVLRFEAQKTGERYLNPGELKAKGENGKNATHALLADV